MPSKRKLEAFDPNKSDSNDDDFDPTEARPPRSAKKSNSKRSTGGPRKRHKYGGSDVEDDDDDADSLLEGSYSEAEEEDEDVEMNEKTGRAVRKAAKKSVNYDEGTESDVEDEVEDLESDDDVQKRPAKRSKIIQKRTNPDEVEEGPEDDDLAHEHEEKQPSLVIKLKQNPTPRPSRTTRAGSAIRTRGGASAEPTSAGAGTRRSTRAHTIEGDEPVELSNSGRHAIRASRSPEAISRPRATRGSKGVKQPASTIKEEAHETSSYEQEGEDTTMANEIAGTDEQDADDDAVEMEAADIPDVAKVIGNSEIEAQAPVVTNEDEDEDDEGPVMRTGRTRGSRAGLLVVGEDDVPIIVSDLPEVSNKRQTRGAKSKSSQRKNGQEASSDFEPEGEASEDELSASDIEAKKSRGGDRDDEYESSPVRRGRGRQQNSKSNSRRRSALASEEEMELAEEIEELGRSKKRRPARREIGILYEPLGARARKPVDYSIKPLDQIYAADEDAEEAAPTPSRRARGGRAGASQPWERNLHTTFGPFGGGGGPAPVIGGPWGTGAAGGADSDSSDDENMQRPSNVGGNVGMTPTSAFPSGLLPGIGQANNPEAMAGLSGTPANLGKIKSQKALADADPLGVDQDVDFSKIGGLEGHIDQLKEMVQMPLLYPELFLKFKVTPPRGVLFHGPPGTGKTLLARALAAQIGSGGRKITFYMRKGADALSKWVGEAERQLRLLFEEARKTQPSIIFFDEIDGLAPVRSSKQEQIHASIVSTLLALMDGMDGRGQVIVIGATNRPDNIDPALRRPGRFDREFYFPLPDVVARKSIINIHTRDWGIDDAFKDSLAQVTKGYGGADLRALCTEAALNSIQRTYPQIYSSNEKLKVDADKIKVTAKDFMLSVKKMVPSSERATSSGATPLPKVIEPLLRDQLKQIEDILDGLIPIKKRTTALQEAMFEQYEDEDHGFGRETLQQEFEKARVFRPRLLIGGESGMGQAYLGGALLNHFEGLHVQNFDLPTIFSDSARSPEAAMVQLFAEVKRHKPSVIFLPGIDTWYHTLSDSVITTFCGLLRALPPTDPVLVLGITDCPTSEANPKMVRDLFGFSRHNHFNIQRPTRQHREDFFMPIVNYCKLAPKDFPEPLNRKKRKLEVLEIAPPPPPKLPTQQELKAQKDRDHQFLNMLKIQIQPIMDQIQKKYRKFRNPVIPYSQIQYLFDEQDPNFVQQDIAPYRPFEIGTDKDGVSGLQETREGGKFFYNLETTTIEERLSNGVYARPKDFLADIRYLAKDAKHIGDRERILRANELLTNCEVDIASIAANPIFADAENVYQRQIQRAKEKEEKNKKKAALDGGASSAPILGEAIPGLRPPMLPNPGHHPSGLSSNGVSAGDQRHTSNGTSVPSRGYSGDDVEMSGTDDHTQKTSENSQAMMPPNQQWPRMSSGPATTSNLATGGNTQVSQRSGFQEIPHDTSPSQLINDASTTTSGKKTSEGWSTQATNGISHPDSSPVDQVHQSDSQLPDTQYDESQARTSSSDEPWPHSQAHGLARGHLAYASQTPSSGSQPSQQPIVPAFNGPPRFQPSRSKPTSMSHILNDSPVEPTSSQISSDKELIFESQWFDDLIMRLTDGTSGLNVEQLEQLYRELMETLWKWRGEYNRTKVAYALTAVHNDTVKDIEEMQKVLRASQESQMSS